MHPRFIFFPWQKDYSAQPNIFCPYAMSVARPNYRSDVLNIDELGFRFQYDIAGDKIDLLTIRQKYDHCVLLLGNSTGFGVSLTADKNTLGHQLMTAERPCINLCVRGASMQQELAIFQTFKHLLPSPKKIILLTGVCDISIAIQPEDIFSPVVGALNSSDVIHRKYLELVQAENDRASLAKRSFLSWAEKRYLKSSLLQGIFDRRLNLEKITQPPSASAPTHVSKEVFEKNLHALLPLITNVLESWGWIKRATGIEVEVILQPVLGWTEKPMTFQEKACVNADLERIPAMSLYANRIVHEEVTSHFSDACQKHGLFFADANRHFDSLKESDGALFTDICHLTDRGTEKLAQWINSDYSVPGPTLSSSRK